MTACTSCKDINNRHDGSKPIEVVERQTELPSLYIGYLNTFLENENDTSNVFYCSARLRKGFQNMFEEIQTEAIKNKGVQIDEFITRYAVLPTHSDKYFEIDKEIWVYNVHSKLIAKGKFIKHELLDQNIDSELISVYNLNFLEKTRTLDNIPFYYANIPNDRSIEVKWTNYKVLTEAEKNLITVNEFVERVDKSENKVYKYNYNGETFTFFSDGNIYMMLSSSTTTLVFKEEDAMIFDMTPTAFVQNGKPIFLLSCGQPETDYFYSLALIWNGSSYIAI